MSLQDDLLQLAELDRLVVRAAVESRWADLKTALAEYQAMRTDLRIRLLDHPAVSIEEPKAAELARRIGSGERLPADELIERLLSGSGPGRSLEEFGDEDLWTLASDLFYSWFSHHEYVTGLAELRPLVIRGSVADAVSRLARQIKDCYAFQQYDAAYGLCRTLIEASIRDICVRCRLFPDRDDNVVLFEKFTWKQLREKVSSGPLQERLKSLYDDLSTLVHARKNVTKDEARRAFEETLQVVEELYKTHGL